MGDYYVSMQASDRDRKLSHIITRVCEYIISLLIPSTETTTSGLSREVVSLYRLTELGVSLYYIICACEC